jgi:hypothetical protein
MALVAASRNARADETVNHPGDHLRYAVEIEPHLEFAWADWGDGGAIGGGVGYGAGIRFSIPIVYNGFVPSINNSVAIGFGLDFLHFGCDTILENIGNYSCDVNSLSFPVVLQWNFYVSRNWSVFGEPGLFIYHQFVDLSCNGQACPTPTETSVLPAFYVGGRYRLNNRLAFTMRVGYPTASFGLSFFD